MTFGEHAGKLIAHTLTRHLVSLSRELLNGRESGGINSILKTCGEADSPQHAQFVFGKTPLGFADGANDSPAEVLLPADKIQHLVLFGIEKQAVDGEVPALDVFPGIATEADFIRMTSIGVADVGTKGRDL